MLHICLRIILKWKEKHQHGSNLVIFTDIVLHLVWSQLRVLTTESELSQITQCFCLRRWGVRQLVMCIPLRKATFQSVFIIFICLSKDGHVVVQSPYLKFLRTSGPLKIL